jgi:hypothetical protein
MKKGSLIAVSSIFFLRFICPTFIMNKIIYLNKDLNSNTKKLLILLTKIIQTIANGVQIDEVKKEPWLYNFKDIINNYQELLFSFLETISSIDDDENFDEKKFLQTKYNNFEIHEFFIINSILILKNTFYETIKFYDNISNIKLKESKDKNLILKLKYLTEYTLFNNDNIEF